MRSEARAALDAALRPDRLRRGLALVGLVGLLLGVGWLAITGPASAWPSSSRELVGIRTDQAPPRTATGVLTRVDAEPDGRGRGITLRRAEGGEVGFVLDAAAAAPVAELRRYQEHGLPVRVASRPRAPWQAPQAVRIVPDDR